MARRKRYSQTAVSNRAPSHSAAGRGGSVWTKSWSKKDKKSGNNEQMKQHELTFILRTLSTLIDNGVSLPKALATLSREETLAKHRPMLEGLQRKIASGVAFSAALGDYPHVCNELMLNQIRVGERSGNLGDTLKQLASSRDKASELKREIVKKLAYPAMLVVMGSGLITFLLMYVVPVFQETYDKAGVPLPLITQVLISVGAFAKSFGWMIAIAVVFAIVTIKILRKRDHFATAMDRKMLQLPMIGKWLRDIAVLQLMEVLRNLLESGFTLAEALGQVAESVGNRAVREGVGDLRLAVQRGERFSRELERHDGMFPPIVNQLVLVGERTGKLDRATEDICDHLRREIQRKTTLMVGALEPILTITMAGAVAVILLAIYLPMFDMVNTMS